MPDNKDSLIFTSYSLKEILFLIFARWYLMIAILLLSTILSLIYSYCFVTPLYNSSGKIYIMSKDNQDINSGDISVSSYLAKDYENLIVDPAVLSEVAEKMNYKYSTGMLQSCVTVDTPEYTRFIEITVRTPNPSDSKKIVDYICEISQEKIVDLLGIDQVNIVRRGNTPRNPSVPNVWNNLLKFDSVCLVLYLITVFIFAALNDKINTQDDVQKALDLNVLCVIPYNPSNSKSK